MGKLKIDPSDRIGITRLNRHGNKMIVSEYKSPVDILVKFPETNEIVHTSWLCFCKGSVKSLYDRTICGVGYIGIGNYKVTEKSEYTPQYKAWYRMISRCYSKKMIERNPTYKGCTVSEEWHNLQNFAKWYDENFYQVEGEKISLDKDILIKGNKVYSPNTCVFTPQFINCLFIKAKAIRGKYPIGVRFQKLNGKFESKCSDETGETVSIGFYDNPYDAFISYKSFKEKIIKKVANKYKNEIPKKLYNAMLNYKVDIED